MKNQSYKTSFEVSVGQTDVFDRINEVGKWFKGKGFEGSSTKAGDEFIFRYGEGDHSHYSKQKLIEFVPGKKVVWLVTDSMINWIKNNKEEWTGTKMVFELNSEGDKTTLHFTHEGLVPELECYAEVEKGWDMIIGDWLFNYVTSQQ